MNKYIIPLKNITVFYMTYFIKIVKVNKFSKDTETSHSFLNQSLLA